MSKDSKSITDWNAPADAPPATKDADKPINLQPDGVTVAQEQRIRSDAYQEGLAEGARRNAPAPDDAKDKADKAKT